MELLGYFGKVPSARDFVFHGLPTRVTEAWAKIVTGWMTSIRSEGEDAFQRGVLSSPVWRFLLPAGFGGEAGVNGAAGLMAGSIDGAGRVFPFAVLLVSRNASSLTRPDAKLDKALDRIEDAMLGFMEDQIGNEAFVETLKSATADVSLTARELATPAPLLADMELAACFGGVDPAWSGRQAAQIMSLPALSSSATGAPENYWWHEGHGRHRPAQLYAVRGLPAYATARPLFLADWSADWRLRTLTTTGPV